MKAFAALYHALDASTSNLIKQATLQQYLRVAGPRDAAWAVYFLAGGKPRQLVPTKVLRALAQRAAGLPEWLFEESHDAVGDLAETISLLLPAPTQVHDLGLADWIEQHLLPLRELQRQAPERLDDVLLAQWRQLAVDERLVYFKLITGAFRVGVSRLQVTQALAAVGGVDAKRVAQRLMGYTHIGARPGQVDYQSLIAPESETERLPQTSGQPYPFFLAHPFNQPTEAFDDLLGPPGDWIVEWKWDGIRAQLVRRAGQCWIWSRGEELVSDRFPELMALGEALPDGTVLDGEIVVWRGAMDAGATSQATETQVEEGRVQPFAELQRRIGRKTLGPKLLREIPVVLLGYDLLEQDGQDLRRLPQAERRTRLDALIERVNHPALRPSPTLQGTDWADLARQREAARSLGVEGMMLKGRDAQYGVGRTRDVGIWWKWKIEPLTIDAVLIYAQRGHGRRASLYSDYTFAVWDGPPQAPDRKLVPFAKAYSGLTDAEMAKVDAIVRRTTVESFGPVRSVEPTQVFELGFEGIARSTRHKSGIAVRFPRMLRWRQDKPLAEADTLQTLAALLPGGTPDPDTASGQRPSDAVETG